MGNQVRFKADLDDKVSSKLDKIRDKFNQVGGPGTAASLFGNIGAKAAGAALGIVAAAVGAVVGKFDEMQRAYREDEASQAKLRASLKANSTSYTGNTEAIEGVIQSRLRLGFSDDEQRDSLASLVTRTKDHIRALGLQRLAMDLARLRGMDLAAASDLVGKAYSGQVGALRRAGIAVDANATATEALAAVQKAANGQAEAFANTSSGKYAAAQVRAGEVSERFGKVIDRIVQSILPPLVSGLEAVADAFDSLGIGVEKSMTEVVDLAAAGSEGAQRQLRTLAAQAGVSVEQFVTQTKIAAHDATAAIKDADAGFARVASDYADGLPEAMDDAADAAIRIVRRTPQDIANALRDGRQAWKSAVDQLGTDIENRMTLTAERAALKAELMGENIRKGLKSKDPVIRAQALATQQILLERWMALSGKATVWGALIGQHLADGLKNKAAAVAAAAALLGAIIAANLRPGSPTKEGPLSKGGGMEAWGSRLADNLAGGLAGRVSAVEAAASRLAGGVAMAAGSPAFGPSRRTVGSDGGAPVEFPIVLDGREIARVISPHLYYLQQSQPSRG